MPERDQVLIRITRTNDEPSLPAYDNSQISLGVLSYPAGRTRFDYLDDLIYSKNSIQPAPAFHVTPHVLLSLQTFNTQTQF
jgi:hypothetical protein